MTGAVALTALVRIVFQSKPTARYVASAAARKDLAQLAAALFRFSIDRLPG